GLGSQATRHADKPDRRCAHGYYPSIIWLRPWRATDLFQTLEISKTEGWKISSAPSLRAARPCSNEYRASVSISFAFSAMPYRQKSSPMSRAASSTPTSGHGSVTLVADISLISATATFLAWQKAL